MNTKKYVILLAFLLVIFAVNTAHGANTEEEDTRYFVQTTKGFWKNTLSARHVFSDGFTADLADWQYRVARLAGLKLYPVKKLNILESAEVVMTSLPEPTDDPSITRVTPSVSVAWGVEMLLGDIAKPIIKLASSQPDLDTTLAPEDILEVKIPTVAVIDSGVYVEHPDLSNRIKECKDFAVDDKSPLDGQCIDENGHGTHVAGIIAADRGVDGAGIRGVAPVANLLVYKACLKDGSCFSDDVAMAIRLATDNGANIINLGIGADQKSSLVEDAVNYATSKGLLVIAAAGNDGPYDDSVDWPAAMASVISVGAIDSSLNVPEWSSRGNNADFLIHDKKEGEMEMAAPGSNIESTWKDGGYVILSGTSMSCAHISGLAALLWKFDDENPSEATRKAIHKSSSDIAPMGNDASSGWGVPMN